MFSACKNFDWNSIENKLQNATTPSLVGTTGTTSYAPVQGIYNTSQSVGISSATSGATICYSTNAVEPDCSPASGSCTAGMTYAAPVVIASNTTLKSVACKQGSYRSSVTNGNYSIDTVAPSAAGSFAAVAGDTEISLAWVNPPDADFAATRILRKVGSFPANSSDGVVVYTGAGTSAIDTGLTNGTAYFYAAYAYDLAGNFALASQSTATPNGGSVNAPSFSPSEGIFNSAQVVTLSSTTSAAKICFTTNGSAPACDATPTCVAGSEFLAPLNIAANTTVKAVACKNGATDSGISSAVFSIDTVPPVISGIAPATSSTVNSTLVSYTLSETCAAGSITWLRTSGAADATVHMQQLTASERLIGSHMNISLIDNPILVEGAVYSITFNCADAAGNSASPVTSTNIMFDVSPPANVSALRVIPGNARNTLVWTNPVDADLTGIRIVRKTGSFPANSADGTVIFDAAGTNFLDAGLTNGITYYYAAFAHDLGNNLASGVTTTGMPFVPCGGSSCRIFVTALAFDGNLGGAVGADALCNADSAKPNSSTYKALITQNSARQACLTGDCAPAAGVEESRDWPLHAATNYVRADGTTNIGATTTKAIFSAPLANAVAGGGTQVWTGLTAVWTTSPDTCFGWTDALPASSGARGTANAMTNSSWAAGQNPCNVSRALYCVEQ